MASDSATSGMCDLCGKEADARYEDCHVLFCTANCHREDGDIYHADCLKKFIGSGSKGTAKHLPSIPYSNFLCPKGKGKGPAKDDPVPCKGLAHHCKRVFAKAEPKAPPPQVLPEKRPKPQPKAANKVAAPRVPAKPAKPKAPPMSDFNPRAKLPPMPEAPKADPLGRNLDGKGQQELPPGYVDEAEAAAERARQGKAAKKNQKRAAKRKEEGGPGWDASSANGSVSGTPGLEEVLSQASLSFDNNAAAGDTGSVASGSRFITNIDAYHALLARHMDLSDDSSEYDYDSDDDEATSHVAESAPVPQWSQQQEDEPADQEGWQAVGVKGKAAPPVVSPLGGAASSSRGQEPGEDPAELQRREEELLRAAIQASMEEAGLGGPPAATADEDEQLQKAMQESLALEEAQRRWEQEQQAALLAAAQARQQRQHSAESQHSAETSGGGGWPGMVMADSGDGWGSAGSADSAATAWGISYGTPQHAPAYQQQQPYTNNPYAARAPAAAAAAPAPPYLAYAAPTAAYAASATPSPLAATVSAPAVTTTAAAYHPAAVQQQQPPLPWLQPAAVSAPTAAMPAYPSTVTTAMGYQAAPAAAAPAAQDDEDSLEDLLALLDV